MAFKKQQSNDDVEINRDGDSRPNNQRRRGDGNDRDFEGDRGRGRRGGYGDDGQQRRRDNGGRGRGRGNRDYDDREDGAAGREETKQPRRAANNKPREQIFNNNDAFPEL